MPIPITCQISYEYIVIHEIDVVGREIRWTADSTGYYRQIIAGCVCEIEQARRPVASLVFGAAVARFMQQEARRYPPVKEPLDVHLNPEV